jgi:hypothetical protein
MLRWMALHGVKAYFSSFQNCFDFMLIVTDVTQIVTSKFIQSSLFDDTPSASLFRIARLVRLVRLLRIIRLDACEDLIAMIGGMIGGMTTLMWALVLFLLVIYVTALLFREFYGRTPNFVEETNLQEYFRSVPRSMLTVFRYFFGDLDMNSSSLFEMIQEAYGPISGIFVCTVFFMITIGLFNVIAAIFVESTLDSARDLQISRKTERMNDTFLWTSRMALLVQKLFSYNGTELEGGLHSGLSAVSSVTIGEHVFDRFILDQEVVKALNDLEIDAADHKYLFDILDNDNTGTIVVSQLVDGLTRLRGDPRRSDIICVDLMVRDMQSKLNMLVDKMDDADNRKSASSND